MLIPITIISIALILIAAIVYLYIKMPKGPFCQSCGMPMKQEKDFGTETNNTPSKDYCCFCYQRGSFTDPNLTMNQMIDRVATIMAQMNNMPKEKAVSMLKKFFPRLKRWR